MLYITYHKSSETTDCPDGIMSAAVVALAARKDFELMGDVYRNSKDYEPMPDFEKYPFTEGDEVIIVDFSYPATWLSHWVATGVKLTVIDHHEAKFPMLSGFANAILDASECGATLTWKHYFSGYPLPELLIHVRRRDIGKDGYYKGLCRDSEAINEGLGHWRKSFSGSKKEMVLAIGDILTLNDPQLIDYFQRIGEPLLEMRDRTVAEVVRRALVRELLGYSVPFVSLSKTESRYVSIVGNELAKTYSDRPFAWVETDDGRNHLRSCNGFDVRPIAEHFGGGGHAPAAGFDRIKIDGFN